MSTEKHYYIEHTDDQRYAVRARGSARQCHMRYAEPGLQASYRAKIQVITRTFSRPKHSCRRTRSMAIRTKVAALSKSHAMTGAPALQLFFQVRKPADPTRVGRTMKSTDQTSFGRVGTDSGALIRAGQNASCRVRLILRPQRFVKTRYSRHLPKALAPNDGVKVCRNPCLLILRDVRLDRSHDGPLVPGPRRRVISRIAPGGGRAARLAKLQARASATHDVQPVSARPTGVLAFFQRHPATRVRQRQFGIHCA